MKSTKITLAAMALLLSTAAMAQQSTGVAPAKSERTVVVPVQPVQPVLPVRPAPAPVDQKIKNSQAERNHMKASLENEAVNQTTGRPVGQELKNAAGMIRIDFGVATAGDKITTFFPFNIATLEPEETPLTPVIDKADYIRYTALNRESGVKDVKLAVGMKYRRGGVGPMAGNGFNLAYLAAKPGAVDEVVQVYTKKGNILYRLTGYVVARGTDVSVK